MENEASHSPIEHLIAEGERLEQAAAIVGDQDDLHVWRATRNHWVRRATWALVRDDPREYAVQEFRDAVRVQHPKADWRHALGEELNSVNAGIDALRAVGQYVI